MCTRVQQPKAAKTLVYKNLEEEEKIELGDFRAASIGPEWQCHVEDEGGSSTGEIQFACS